MSDPREPEEQTRYARQQEKLRQQERHAAIVQKLSAGVVEEFEGTSALLDEPPPCVSGGVPSEWTDWDRFPERREPQDGKMPTAHRARQMCEGCLLMKNDLCYRYALATDKQHGVWGGRRIYNGSVVRDGEESADVPNRERLIPIRTKDGRWTPPMR
jgi:hypothetical protein